jgi:hypothetical protein
MRELITRDDQLRAAESLDISLRQVLAETLPPLRELEREHEQMLAETCTGQLEADRLLGKKIAHMTAGPTPRKGAA